MVGCERRDNGADAGSVLLIRAWLEAEPCSDTTEIPVSGTAPRPDDAVRERRPRARLLGVDVEGEPSDTFTTAQGVDEICLAVRAWLTGLSSDTDPDPR
ncbi:hypothetical protein [Motilibacter deserti]|uniref:Uncharacterized protein n=1 Tax=Motilibacter deserti TaxID=2714956 RepID=A0ABX0GXV9_9ACTN|nr:hypothetical protein [Motilibacter deserti]NHC14506.1 hypothetical protein [Motilibacter deserti]